MKKTVFLGLFFLTLLVFTVVSASKSEGAAATTVAAAGTADVAQMAQMIKPTLEAYMKNHPNVQVRIWSMVVMVNINKLTSEQLFSITPMILQLSSKDTNIRQIALSSIRSTLDLEDSEWGVILATIFRTIAKSTKYPEVRRLAIKSMSIASSTTSSSDTTATTSSDTTTTSETSRFDPLLLLFELAEDEDPEIRQVAVETIKETLESLKPGILTGGSVPVNK